MNEIKKPNKLTKLLNRLLNKKAAFEGPESDEEATLVVENRSRINRQLYYEAASALHRKWTRFVEIAFGALLLVSGIAGGYMFLTVTGAIIFILSLLSWRILVQRDFRLLRELNGGEEWSKTIRFYSNRIETENGAGRVKAYRYENVKRFCETKHMFVLDFGKKSPATMMCKDGFVAGTFETVKSFVADMCL